MKFNSQNKKKLLSHVLFDFCLFLFIKDLLWPTYYHYDYDLVCICVRIFFKCWICEIVYHFWIKKIRIDFNFQFSKCVCENGFVCCFEKKLWFYVGCAINTLSTSIYLCFDAGTNYWEKPKQTLLYKCRINKFRLTLYIILVYYNGLKYFSWVL